MNAHLRMLAPSAWIFGCAAALFLASCKPSTEFSTPTQAGLAFARAVMTGDMNSIHQAAVGSDADFAAIQSLSDLMVALKRLETAAVKSFGNEGKLSKDGSKDLVAMVQACDERITGDTATLVNRNDPNDVAMTLIKGVGGWKVNLSAVLNNDNDLGQLSKKGTALVAAIDATTQKIESGKYKTAPEARSALREAMATAAKVAH
jgi:hypothetical protein